MTALDIRINQMINSLEPEFCPCKTFLTVLPLMLLKNNTKNG